MKNKINDINSKTLIDHRIINKQLDLYHIQENTPGLIFWHNNGYIIFNEIKKFLRTKLKENNYQEVKTPIILNQILWEKTGHWENYEKLMFKTYSEKRNFCIKPMNCPGHILIFNNKIRSYRDLPFRISEFGNCNRDEPSGSLHGLMRVKSFTQDDAHIFCTEEQIFNEVTSCINIIYDVYNTFGFKKIKINLATRPEKFIGNINQWNECEKELLNVLKKNNISFNYKIGEGAFYGPKIEFTLYDFLKRSWQCGTIQLDLLLPYKLKSFYINKKNEHKVPVMIHRAILGSLERFIGILIEEFLGFLPTWLSPIQVVIINVNINQHCYVNKIKDELINKLIRVKIDLRNENVNFKIREYSIKRIPYILICGPKEEILNKVNVRLGKGKNIGIMSLNNFIKKIKIEIDNKDINNMEE